MLSIETTVRNEIDFPFAKKKIIINIDETWMNQTDFLRKKWRLKRRTNSMPEITLSNRVSLIAAIDIMGEIYLTVSQSNTSSQIMGMFLFHLVNLLTKKDPNWR